MLRVYLSTRSFNRESEMLRSMLFSVMYLLMQLAVSIKEKLAKYDSMLNESSIFFKHIQVLEVSDKVKCISLSASILIFGRALAI